MSASKKKTPADELLESLLKDIGQDQAPVQLQESNPDDDEQTVTNIEGLVLQDGGEEGFKAFNSENDYSEKTENEFESTEGIVNLNAPPENFKLEDVSLVDIKNSADESDNIKLEEDDVNLQAAMGALMSAKQENTNQFSEEAKTELVAQPNLNTQATGVSDSEKTVAVAGYQARTQQDKNEDNVKVSIGQNKVYSGYNSWSGSGNNESNLVQAEHLRIAQEKIVELEKENSKLRSKNEELMAASEIIKERSDLLSSQLNEFKNDREQLADSYKNELAIVKNHLTRKDSEVQRLQFKNDELDSKLKFDMKKIRVRERELENRLELIRAEKNAILKNKDEQILDLKRKMDVLQMELDSYRQKCIDLNRSIESSQESFKRTTRALRLAMANLELQEENKNPLKKVD